MSDKLYLAFCVHSHQPVGNFPKVFEQGARDCYLPLLRILHDYPGITMTLHFTGPLWDWFTEHDQEFFRLLHILVERGQVELMGGGFYEPIMSVVPERDAHEQLEYMSSYLQNTFGARPRGMWCAERIWEPAIPKKIAGSGIEYTLLDDTHFLAAGLNPEDVHGYYITEREGYALKVFPIDMRMRYLIPFRQPHEIIEHLFKLKSQGVRVVTYGDDGEKFGMWPGTHKWVIEEGWLRWFFEEMLKVSSEIEIVPLSKVIDTFPAKGRIYLPTSSYQEMMEWSLFSKQGRVYEDLVHEAKDTNQWERQRPFLRGGTWDNFLAKYPESNFMHKKMLKVSSLVREHGPSQEGVKRLMMAQTNCPYWHGLFGGVYISSLRHAIYENLLHAESLIDPVRFNNDPWVVEKTDHDVDGYDEILVSGSRINCYLAPRYNGAAFAVEDKARHYSFSNILMRHEEIYHRKILAPVVQDDESARKEPLSIHDIHYDTPEEYKDLLIYDTYPRYSFMTHCLKEEPRMDDILKKNILGPSLTADLLLQCGQSEQTGDHLTLCLNGSRDDLAIEKVYRFFPQGRIEVGHKVDAPGQDLWFAVEFNFMNISGARPFVDGIEMADDRGTYHASAIELKDQDKGAGISLRSDVIWEIFVVPIECISQSEEGFEKSAQGWSIYWVRKLDNEIPRVILEVL